MQQRPIIPNPDAHIRQIGIPDLHLTGDLQAGYEIFIDQGSHNGCFTQGGIRPAEHDRFEAGQGVLHRQSFDPRKTIWSRFLHNKILSERPRSCRKALLSFHKGFLGTDDDIGIFDVRLSVQQVFHAVFGFHDVEHHIQLFALDHPKKFVPAGAR